MSRRDYDGGNGTEDELGAPTDAMRSTSRRSGRGRNLQGIVENTPHADLRQLSGIIQDPSTPRLRATSTGPRSISKGIIGTPVTTVRTPGLGRQRRPIPAKVGPSTTPHAIRALQRRQAAAAQTPARNRRRSGRHQHETPRDILRNLSKVLSKTTVPPEPTPPLPPAPLDQDQSESDADLPRPRLSMNIEELNDDDSFQAPPTRRSEPSDDGMHTERSVEVPRRAYSEMPLTRGSLGSIRISERFGDSVDPEEAESRDMRADGSELSNGLIDIGDESGLPGDYDDAIADESGLLSARFSDIRSRNLFQQDGDTSFAFDIPINSAMIQPFVDTGRGQDNDANHILEPSKSDAIEAPVPDRLLVGEPKPRLKLRRKSRNNTPSLSAGVVKKLANSFARSSSSLKSKINKETLGAIMQASDWFFEQIGSDLGAYAEHAGRKTVDETDVTTLMKRRAEETYCSDHAILLGTTVSPEGTAPRHTNGARSPYSAKN
ncbi:hypothetical protein MMC30_005831 [Trapelia coarctata]|nr:hypothetical protein [Trapelia coarctata]